MAKKQNIVQYRERLDRTLSSPDLTNYQILKTLVKSQLPRSSQLETEGYEEQLEIKTAEVSNLLDMMRSASVDDSGGSSTSRTDWKLKQDNEEFRVMYREGPEGTPFHTLLVEGYVDGPVDVCLCLSWESSLYKKWWPQFTVPTFKIIASDCLQKVQIGEQISLVRMKLTWPLSTREVIVHYYLFEYFQDDMIMVLLKSVPESKSANRTIDGFNNDAIPEAKGVVRMDLVGGFVLQKVTSERSYFRTIANMDIKLDIVPPSLINFISRQLIGSGFRLYKKAVASIKNHDEEFSKALGDSLYVRIHEALYSISRSNAIMDGEELKQVANILPAEELVQSKQDEAKDIQWGDRSNQDTNNYNGEILDAGSEEIVQIEEDVNKVHDIPIEEGDTWTVLKGKRNSEIIDANSEEIVEADSEEIVQIVEDVNKGHNIPIEEGDTWTILKGKSNSEIVDADSEEIVQIEEDVKKVHDIPIEEDDTRSVLKEKRNVYISSGVKQALDTLERAISLVREYGFHSRRSFSSFAKEATGCTEKGGMVDSYSAKLIQPSAKNGASVEESSSNNIPQEPSEDLYEIQNFRHTGTNANLREVNYNKVVPASPEQNLLRPIEASHVDSHSLKNETTLDQTIYDNKQLNSDAGQDMSSDDTIKSSRQKKLNTIETQGISSDVPKQLSKRKKYRYYCCFVH